MTDRRANKDVAARRPLSRATVLAAAATAALGVLVTAGPTAGQTAGPTILALQDIGTGPAQPQPQQTPVPGQPYPNAAAGQPYGGGATSGITAAGPGDLTPATPATPAAPAPAATPVAMAAVVPTTGPATTGPTTAPSAAPADNAIHLEAGRSVVLHLAHPAATVTVGSPDVLKVSAAVNGEAHPRTDPQTLILTGLKGGSTAVLVGDDRFHVTEYDVTVDPDLTALRNQLHDQFPGVPVHVSVLGDSVGLHGVVQSDKVAAQVCEVAGTFAKVHNFLEVAGGQQIMLQIRFAEVDRSAIRNLGVNFGGTDGISSFANNIGQVNPLGFIASGTGVNGLALGAVNGGSAVQFFGQGRFATTAFAYFIQALEENGLVRMLAEPNVVATNGTEASFTAGGEFPVPVSQGGGSGAGAAVTVQYQEYGIRLNFMPLVLGNGQIRLKVAPEVSELDYSNAVKSNGFSIPALTKRKVSTTVELADGQSFALAGLLSDNTSATTDAVPLLGDIPVFGTLFRSTRYQRQQTELVVLVTPRLVGPTDPDTTAALPGEHWRFPTDAGVYFLHDLGGNQLERTKDGSRGADMSIKPTVPPRAFHGTYGFTPNGSGNVGSESK